ncbi:MAG TPA: HAMP domain-containing sensor histidine kinase [Opitutus sp.]|nr:HAMP domain-containing sensor histidine kinase [Opitutus sp.]
MLREELRAADRAGQRCHFAAGEIIFSAGDAGDGFYIVDRGRVEISASVGESETRVLATIGPDDFFGEMAILDEAPRSATARAELETDATFYSRAELLQILDQRPRLALDLVREFIARMRAINQKYLEEIIQVERLAIVGRFARMIVHDIRNPLAVIGIAAEVACSDMTPAPMRQKAQNRIAQQVTRVTDMLQELIAFTKADARPAEFTTVSFVRYMNPLAEEIGPEIASRNVRLVLADPPPDVPVRIQPKRLSRLFYNLLNNAIDEMPRGGAITLRFAIEDGELVIAVQDEGKGIAPEIAASLFKPFVTHGKEHGTGLGLMICKKIVEDHNGRIWATSEPGQGATFRFTLPLGK